MRPAARRDASVRGAAPVRHRQRAGCISFRAGCDSRAGDSISMVAGRRSAGTSPSSRAVSWRFDAPRKAPCLAGAGTAPCGRRPEVRAAASARGTLPGCDRRCRAGAEERRGRTGMAPGSAPRVDGHRRLSPGPRRLDECARAGAAEHPATLARPRCAPVQWPVRSRDGGPQGDC